MAEKVLMIALSPTMETGRITKWHSAPGDRVETGDVICEVETDKATMDYEALQEGTLLKILVDEGGEAAVGEPIALIGEEGEDVSDVEVEKAPVPKPAEKKPEKVEEKPEKISEPEPVEEDEADDDRIKASPLARRMAAKMGIDLKNVEGSGPGGRIVKRDVENYEPSAAVPEPEVQRPAVKGISKVEIDSYAPDYEVIPVNGKRRVIAQRLSSSKYSAPHYYLKVNAEMDELIFSRDELNEGREKRISFNAFLIKFAAEALKRHPEVNSYWLDDTAIIRYKSIDVGLAVAVPDGLITPVIRDCGNKGITQIDEELKVLVKKAQENKLKPDEFNGATFTISNLGSFGIDEFTAVINPPASAILAVGKIRKEPFYDEENDEFYNLSKMSMTLSCDHRVIDGATGAHFLNDLKEMMENPMRTLL